MQVKLSDAELNAFLATKVMGWTLFPEQRYYFSEDRSESIYLYQWDPLTDRNQLQLCLEKVLENSENLRVNQRKIINHLVSDHFHRSYEDCGARELFRLLTASPRAIAEAIYLTLEGQDEV